MWLSHDEKRTANWYKHYDPDYLSDAMQATDNIIRELQAFCVLVPVLRANRPPKSHQGGVKLSAMYWKKMVGATGIEPVTPSMSRKCSPAELRARSKPAICSGSRPYIDLATAAQAAMSKSRLAPYRRQGPQ